MACLSLIVTKVSQLCVSRPQHTIKLIFNTVLWFFSSLFCSLFPVGYDSHQAPERTKTGCCNGKNKLQASSQAPPFLYHLELILTWLWDLCPSVYSLPLVSQSHLLVILPEVLIKHRYRAPAVLPLGAQAMPRLQLALFPSFPTWPRMKQCPTLHPVLKASRFSRNIARVVISL